MIGFGITLPVLPFYVERLALAGGASRQSGIALITAAQTQVLVFVFVALLALGMALIAPNLTALVSKRSGERQAGASLGVQNAANSLGQAIGPVVGSALFIWKINAPYLLTGALLITVALVTGWKTMSGGARRTLRRFE